MSQKTSVLFLSLIVQILIGCSSTEFGECPGTDGMHATESASCLKQYIEFQNSNPSKINGLSISIPLTIDSRTCTGPFRIIERSNLIGIEIQESRAFLELTAFERVPIGNGQYEPRNLCKGSDGNRSASVTCTVTIKPNVISESMKAAINSLIQISNGNQSKMIFDIDEYQINNSNPPWKSQRMIKPSNSLSTIQDNSAITTAYSLGDITNMRWTITETLSCLGNDKDNVMHFPMQPYIYISSLRLE